MKRFFQLVIIGGLLIGVVILAGLWLLDRWAESNPTAGFYIWTIFFLLSFPGTANQATKYFLEGKTGKDKRSKTIGYAFGIGFTLLANVFLAAGLRPSLVRFTSLGPDLAFWVGFLVSIPATLATVWFLRKSPTPTLLNTPK